jgi:hypothetical protein
MISARKGSRRREHYFSTPSAERVRDVLSPEAESFPDRGVCVGV